jgi:hypothetical protein
MRFFRRRSSPGLVALLVLAMQAALVLAQTHVHSHVHTAASAYRTGVSAGARAWAKGVVAIACRAVVHPGCAPPAPHDHRNECPMCWSVTSAGTGVMPAAPAVALDAPRFAMLASLRADAVATGHAITNFQARAPPVG